MTVRDDIGQAYQQNLGRMLNTARKILKSDLDAEDAVQRAVILALRNQESFNGTSKVGTWLHRIVINEALQMLRDQKRHPTLVGCLPEMESGALPDELTDMRLRLRRVAVLPPRRQRAILDLAQHGQLMWAGDKVELLRARQALQQEDEPCVKRRRRAGRKSAA